MKKVLAIVVLVLSVGLVPLAGENAEGSWPDVLRLSPGSRVEVVDMHLRSFTGKLVRADEQAITVESGSSMQTLAQKDVYRVSRRGTSKRFRNALIGAAIGAGAGIAAGLPRDLNGSEKGEYQHSMFYGMGGAAAGLLVGALIPSGNETVYRAEKPRR